MAKKNIGSIAVLTSGGDAQGMNAALRAVVRAGIQSGFMVYAVYEGLQGLVDDLIHPMDWESVSGIMDRGGTVIGTARSKEFRERSGLLKSAHNLIRKNIDKLVVIGGDGSLSGANEFRELWPELVAELLSGGQITPAQAQAHPQLKICGMVGSIDNDMADTDMTIGADSALHRITEAIDALSSTAFSHQRTFIVEVMGRNCGYLALMSAVAGSASVVFMPEAPPESGWEDKICRLLTAGKEAGRRDNIIIVAEGAKDSAGKPITPNYIQEVLATKLNMDSRITILGHVQRGGAPSAFDRYMGTVFGCAAVNELAHSTENSQSKMVALQDNRIVTVPLMDAVEKTRSIAKAINDGQYAKAEALRGSDWGEMIKIYKTLCMSLPTQDGKKERARLGLITCGWPAPGMNAALRTATRIGMEMGYDIYGIENGITGLIEGDIRALEWMEVEDWNCLGGSKIGANRALAADGDFYRIAKNIEKFQLKGLLVIGGWNGYLLVDQLHSLRRQYPAFDLPIVCVPASINNNLPGSELAIGSDTALNTIVEAVDKIKHSADSSRRVFMVEVMGRYCGYLAMMSGLATGAEIIYLHEDNVSLARLQEDLAVIKKSFEGGDRRIALIIRNEMAHPIYTAPFICSLFSAESDGLFDVRESILGPMQQGGTPSPFDRIQAVRLGADGLRYLISRLENNKRNPAFIGQSQGGIKIHEWSELNDLVSNEFQRPYEQWWRELQKVTSLLAIKPSSAKDANPKHNEK